MTVSQQPILQLENVSRVFPRDATHIPATALRELVLPRSFYGQVRPHSFYAVRDVNLCLQQGQCVGVIGSYRSGKSTLAAIASGVLAPTSGKVTVRGRAHLLGKANASYRPMLSVAENMRFRGRLAGLQGAELEILVEKCLQQANIGPDRASAPFINLPPHTARRVGVLLALNLPCDLLVLDGSLAGGRMRYEVEAIVHERMTQCAALVVSDDSQFLGDVAPTSLLLHAGRAYGPFPTTDAFDHFMYLPSYEEDEDAARTEDNAPYDPMHPPTEGQQRRADPGGDALDDMDDDDQDEESVDDEHILNKKKHMPAVTIEAIFVDGAPYRHAHHSPLRAPGETLRVSLRLLAARDTEIGGGVLTLHGGASGAAAGSANLEWPAQSLRRGQHSVLSFEFPLPELTESFYGLSFTPFADDGHAHVHNRLKVLIFGTAALHKKQVAPPLTVANVSLKSAS
ncbi:MAG: ATP-binding cassette domain-containing protein [Bdellovibrionales bacterium]